MVITFSFLRLSVGLLLVLICSTCFAQISSELNFITTANPLDKPEVKEDLSFSLKEPSELKNAFMGLIRFYQNFVSSQQNNQSICVFSPSCSRFGFASIKAHGLFYGILMTSDRLQRCHGFSRSNYLIHLESGKMFNPIDQYYLKIKRW